jgi:hypothetical protein
MSDSAILLQFLGSTLPQALLAKAAILIPVVGALISLIIKAPAARARKKWIGPLLAILLGQIAGQATTGFAGGQWLLGAGLGLFIALSTIGAHSGGKNGSEALRTRRKAT